MKLEFSKMHGCGNDYIYFNCMSQFLPNVVQIAKLLSDRHFGVGADGIVLICPSEQADFKMRMFNSDGSEGKMCGNAIRCVAKFVLDEGLFSGDVLKIETLSGVKTVTLKKTLQEQAMFTVDMGAAILDPAKIPVKGKFSAPIVAHPFELLGSIFKITCVSMGNPHCVVFFDSLNKINLYDLGPKFEHSDFFPQGVNAEFVEIKNSNEIKMLVWERGSGPTLACGTGACAAVVAGVLNGYCKQNSDVAVNLPGGKLWVKVADETVFLTGEAVLVFKGFVEV